MFVNNYIILGISYCHIGKWAHQNITSVNEHNASLTKEKMDTGIQENGERESEGVAYRHAPHLPLRTNLGMLILSFLMVLTTFIVRLKIESLSGFTD